MGGSCGDAALALARGGRYNLSETESITMSEAANPAAARTEILVAGAGSTGVAAALAFAKAGWRTTLVGRMPPPLPGRTVALFESSLRFLSALGVLDKVRERACPVESIRMIDDTDQLIPIPELNLRAREVGLPALGLNVSNDELVDILLGVARETGRFELVEADIADYVFDPDSVSALLADGRRIEAGFLVAADGRNSRARAVAGIDTKEWSYPQVALTMHLAHEFPHDNVSTEWHTRSGPFTLVPSRGDDVHPHRSSLVWLMSVADARRRLEKPREELEFEIEDYAKGTFGWMKLDSDIGQFRMGGMQVSKHATGRMALVGETCHIFPPIGAQGLNLSLRDVADLEDCLASVDLDSPSELSRALLRYDLHRRGDIGFRTHGVDVLNRSLIVPWLPVDIARGASFLAVSALGPLRRAIIREGILPHFMQPRLMREEIRRRS